MKANSRNHNLWNLSIERLEADKIHLKYVSWEKGLQDRTGQMVPFAFVAYWSLWFCFRLIGLLWLCDSFCLDFCSFSLNSGGNLSCCWALNILNVRPLDGWLFWNRGSIVHKCFGTRCWISFWRLLICLSFCLVFSSSFGVPSPSAFSYNVSSPFRTDSSTTTGCLKIIKSCWLRALGWWCWPWWTQYIKRGWIF